MEQAMSNRELAPSGSTGSFILVLLLLMSAGQQSFAQPAQFSPASFLDENGAAVLAIQFPDVEINENIALACASNITALGNMADVHCFDVDAELEPFWQSVAAATDGLKITPAKIDGENVEVWFKFIIRFIADGGSRAVQLLPHHGSNMETLGLDYSAAQPRWQQFGEIDRACRGSYTVWTSAKIDVEGKASETAVVASDARSRCDEAILEGAQTRQYIPAFKDGAPIESIYIERWWN